MSDMPIDGILILPETHTPEDTTHTPAPDAGPEAENAVPVEVVPSPKQFLLLVDETCMIILSKLVPNMRFIEVEGMTLKDNDAVMVLVNPKPRG